jgi:PEP-CTERM motif
MKIFHKLSAVALVAACYAGPSMAQFVLPNTGYVQYGDAQSYSLPILGLQSGCTGPGCPYYVNSTPGQISSLTVLGTGAAGNPVVTNFDGMDNAYATPSGVSGSTFWRPSADTDQGTQGTVNNNSTNSWDASLLALKTYLTTGSLVEKMIFFFNNNQENGEEQSLAAWASIAVRDAAGTIIGRFDFVNKPTFDGTPGAYLPVPLGGGVLDGNTGTYVAPLIDTRDNPTAPLAGNAASTDYVLSGGEICLDSAAPGANVVPCSSAAAVVGPINHNLGANQAAYAVIFPQLDALLAGLWGVGGLSDALLAQYTLSVDIRLGCDPTLDDTALVCTGQSANNGFLYGRNLTNGYEQIFISKGSAVVNMPEPGTLVLAGLALLGLGFARRRA